MAGHSLLYILAGFVKQAFFSSLAISLLPFSLVVIVYCLEFAIALLQAYVFLVLLAIYCNESLVLH